MSFEARIYIQGVGIYVPHTEKNELLVLFPSQEKAHVRGLRDSQGKTICRHHAVVQFSARYLDHRLPDAWTSMDLSGTWVGFSAEPEPGRSLPHRLTVDGRVDGVPYLPEILPQSGALDQRAWPGQGSEAEILRAGLHLHAGVLSPYAEYEGLFRFGARSRDDRMYSSVLKLELGQVQSFALRFRPFGAAETSELRLTSPWDELDVWIRHFCNVERPNLDEELPEAGETDVDFVLNYALINQLETFLQGLGGVPLPVPQVSTSWIRGGPIGLEARKCMGGGGTRYRFEAPL